MSDSVQSLYSLGRTAFDRKNYDEALDQFEKLVTMTDGFADVWNMMGQMYHHKGEMKKAVQCFEKALALNANYVDAQFNLAVTYSEIGAYDKAKGLYDEARKSDPGRGDKRIPDSNVRGKIANMHADIADIYHGLGLFRDADLEYRKALSLRPEFPDIRMKMAQNLFDAGKKENAIQELEKVKSDRPEFLKGRLNLGIFLFATGKIDQAVKEWNELLEINPDYERVKTYLKLAEKSKK